MEHFVVWHRLVPSLRDEFDEPNRLSKWLEHVALQLKKAGGRPSLAVGYSCFVEFDAIYADPAIDVCLALLEEAERLQPEIPACFGAAAGTNGNHPDGMSKWRRGTAIDRAQLLANRTRPGSLALGPSAQGLAGTGFLLGKHIATGTSTFTGIAVDRAYPRRRDCRPSVQHLGRAQIPRSVRSHLAPLVSAIEATRFESSKDSNVSSARIILRGPVGSGAHQWVNQLQSEYQPRLVLRPSAVPGSLEPLGSLRLGLLRAFGSAEAVSAAVPDSKTGSVLEQIANGEPVSKEAALDAMRALFNASSQGLAPWIVLDPLASVDPVTVQLTSELSKTNEPAVIVIARLPLSAKIPMGLRRAGPVQEITLPQLLIGDGIEIASAILGPHTAEEVVRRVAVLGGESPLGIEEASRALVSSGDLVYGHPDVPEGAFTWRMGRRGGLSASPVESLLEERLASLNAVARKVLEAACAAPVGVTESALKEILRADGVQEKKFGQAKNILRAEAMLENDLPLRATSDMLRIIVMQGMLPSRLGELYRFTGAALSRTDSGPLAGATSGYFVAEGGDESAGAKAILTAGRLALDHGHRRAAIRMAATAVQFDDSPESRRLASSLSKDAATASGRHVRKKSDTEPPPSLEEETIQAIRQGDREKVERLLDSAVAEGANRSAANRLWAMLHASKQDIVVAMQAMAKARSKGDVNTRNTLARGLVLLQAGEPINAIRAVLETLRQVRGAEDAKLGEAAAMRALLLCLRSLGREKDANMLEEQLGKFEVSES